MTGGSIANNSAQHNYGGIRVNGTMTMTGGSVGVTCADGAGTTFTSGYGTYTHEQGSVFASDNTAYTVTIESNEAKLVAYDPTVVTGPVQYLNVDADGDHDDAYCSDYTLMSTLADNGVTLSNGWYVVDENLTFNKRITISGTVNLILMDNTRLTANNGIYVSINTTLHIWGQSNKRENLDDFMGILNATAKDNDFSGIGGQGTGSDAGDLHFHGGMVSGVGGKNAAGIHGHPCCGPGNYSIYIYGGSVTGIGIENGAGIGGNYWGMCSGILITGGDVHAIGCYNGAGIGSGACGTMHERQGDYHGQPVQHYLLTEIRIKGGEVFAQGQYGAGIGGGALHDNYEGNAGCVYIEGGNVYAHTYDPSPAGLDTEWNSYHGAQAIGRGGLITGSGDKSTVTVKPVINDALKVSATTDIFGSESPVTRSTWDNTDDWGTYKQITLEVCDHPNGTNYSNNGNSLNVGCDYCHTTEPYTFTTAGNWLGSIMPGEGKDVAVKAAATIPSNCCAHVGHIDMQEGGSLTIANGGQLKHSNAVAGTMQKFIAGYNEISNPAGWYLLGAPLRMDSVLAVNSGMVDLVDNHADFTTHGVDLYEFNQNQDLEWRNMRVGNHFRTMGISLNAAYLYARADDCTLNFSTTEDELFAPTTTDTYIAATRATTTPEPEFVGWNLIRNPYTCNAYLASGRDFYRMNAAGDAIVLATAENGGTAIMPCEGIFVVVGEHDVEEYASNTNTGYTDLYLQRQDDGLCQQIPPRVRLRGRKRRQ